MKLTAKIVFAAVSTCLLSAPAAFSQIQAPGPTGQVFLDDYNGYTVQTGAVPPDYYLVGNVTTLGVSTGGVSGQAGFFGVNFNGSGAFGSGFYDTLEGNTLDLRRSTLSIAVRSSAGPDAGGGYFSLRIVDGAGNGSRSPLYNPTTAFTTFAPALNTFVGNGGTGTPNLANITEIDIIAYNLGDNYATTLTFDNFQAAVVPEPSAFACVILLGGVLLVVYKRKQHPVSA